MGVGGRRGEGGKEGGEAITMSNVEEGESQTAESGVEKEADEAAFLLLQPPPTDSSVCRLCQTLSFLLHPPLHPALLLHSLPLAAVPRAECARPQF